MNAAAKEVSSRKLPNLWGRMSLRRFIVIAIAFAYGGVGALLLAAGFLLTLMTLPNDPSPAAFVACAAWLAIGATPFVAGIALFKEKPWSRWAFLATALFSTACLAWSIQSTLWLHAQFKKKPPEGAYQVLVENTLLGRSTDVLASFLVLAIVTVFCAFLVFRHFRRTG